MIRIDMYFTYARLIPAIIVSFPFWFLLYDLNQIPQVADVLSSMLAVKWIGNVSVSVAFQFAWAMLVREIGKRYEEKYFECQKRLPSVYFLMKADSMFSDEFMQRLRGKVLSDFNLKLPKKVTEDDRIYSDIAKMVLEKVKYVKEVVRHNAWYGFYRNLFSGGILGLILSVVMIMAGVAQKQSYSIWGGAILSVVYLAMFLLKRKVITSNGERFARQMYYSYLNLDSSKQQTA